ncbi:hypothetical protein EZY14_009085 [Kordia sp. TARA_039_SRF]|nr:hypothetical protein EZY14_009085 [Kordia sp. TARA_039_SRF]
MKLSLILLIICFVIVLLAFFYQRNKIKKLRIEFSNYCDLQDSKPKNIQSVIQSIRFGYFIRYQSARKILDDSLEKCWQLEEEIKTLFEKEIDNCFLDSEKECLKNILEELIQKTKVN